MFKFIFKKVAPIPKIESFESYLFVGPHPDDIEMGCGATVAKLVQAGKKVYYLVATDGSAGSTDPNLQGEKLIATRQAECYNAMKVLGVTEITFLPFADGGMYDVTSLEKEIAKEIVRVQPDVVFCPDPKVPTECHPDHVKTGEATSYAVTALAPWRILTAQIGCNSTCAAKLLVYYYTHRPNSYVNVSKTFNLQTQALTCFTSQFKAEELALIEKYRKLRAIRFGMCRWHAKADGFFALPPLHQHCFPEASEL